MKLLKPGWVTHDGYPIFSLDIHPDGSRFATGGQGAGDSGRVVIWNMGPIVDEEQETKENVPKFLSRMDNHLNCVNCVRWSSDGKYLASAGDDKVIMIWQIARHNSVTGNTLFGGSTSAETWRSVATLRGHSGDILDLNWSQRESWLASCSVDNTVIIWNTNKWNEIVTVLRGHTGLVKGVSFDPIGTYVASQSDDKTLKVWRTCDWKEECSLTEPFAECGGTTHVLRLNWSPDGQVLVSAHAMNNCGSVAQIVEREGWATKRDYVGHRKAVTCTRFNQNLLKQVTRKRDKEREVTSYCLAIGSRDRSVSVWLTSAERPLVVVHELFENSVMDLSWSSCGRRLFACSWDGSVACIEFEKEELGSVLTDADATLHLERLYGKSIKSSVSANTSLAEDVAFMQAREDILASKSTGNTNGHAAAMHELDNRSLNDSRSSTSSRLLKGPTDKQIEVKLTNGKRRITPLYIPPPTDLEGIPIPFNSQATTFDSSVESKSRIPVEKRDSNLSPAKENSQPPQTQEAAALPPVQAASKADDSAPKTSNTPTEKSRGDVSRKVVSTSSKKKVVPRSPAQVVSSAATATTGKAAPTEAVAPRVQVEGKSRVSLSALSFERLISLPVKGSRFKEHEVEAENKVSNSKLSALRLKNSETGDTVWEVLVTPRIMAAAASDAQTAIACDDRSLSVFSTETGRRLHPPIVLAAMTALLVNSSNKLLAVTTDAHLHLWDFDKRRALVKNESLMPLFVEGTSVKPDLQLVTCSVGDDGTPVVTMSNRKSFAYDLNLNCWSLVADASDLLPTLSDVRQPSAARLRPEAYPLASVQRIQRIARSSFAFQSCSGLQSKATISMLDQQLAAAFVLGSGAEYEYWLLALAQALAEASREERLRELCYFLLGPVFASEDSWDSKVLGLQKRDLLKQVLVILTSNMRLQRLYTEMKEQLSIATDTATSAPEAMQTDPEPRPSVSSGLSF